MVDIEKIEIKADVLTIINKLFTVVITDLHLLQLVVNN